AFIPIGIDADLRSANQRGSRGYDVVARLRRGVSLEEAQREADAVAASMRAAWPGNYPEAGGWTVTLQRLPARMVARARPALPRVSDIHLDGRVVLFTASATAATTVLAGLVPALQSSRVDASSALKEGAHSGVGVRSSRLRSALVVVEVSLALVPLVGAGLL